jgi:hypothetical protein
MLLCIRGVLLVATISVARGANIAGYTTFGSNDVTQHLRIDLDIQNVTNAVSIPDLTQAFKEYSQGNNLHLHSIVFIQSLNSYIALTYCSFLLFFYDRGQ